MSARLSKNNHKCLYKEVWDCGPNTIVTPIRGHPRKMKALYPKAGFGMHRPVVHHMKKESSHNFASSFLSISSPANASRGDGSPKENWVTLTFPNYQSGPRRNLKTVTKTTQRGQATETLPAHFKTARGILASQAWPARCYLSRW